MQDYILWVAISIALVFFVLIYRFIKRGQAERAKKEQSQLMRLFEKEGEKLTADLVADRLLKRTGKRFPINAHLEALVREKKLESKTTKILTNKIFEETKHYHLPKRR